MIWSPPRCWPLWNPRAPELSLAAPMICNKSVRGSHGVRQQELERASYEDGAEHGGNTMLVELERPTCSLENWSVVGKKP